MFRFTKKISPELNEELFSLWMTGKSLMEICQKYAQEPNAFCLRTLLRAKKIYQWDQRRKDILQEMRSRFDEEILLEVRKFHFFYSMISDFNVENVSAEYKLFIADKDGYLKKLRSSQTRPYWMVQNMQEFKELMSIGQILFGKSCGSENTNP